MHTSLPFVVAFCLLSYLTGITLTFLFVLIGSIGVAVLWRHVVRPALLSVPPPPQSAVLITGTVSDRRRISTP